MTNAINMPSVTAEEAPRLRGTVTVALPGRVAAMSIDQWNGTGRVTALLAEGKTSRDISKYLTISLKTAMTHRANIMAKLNVHSRSELIRYAIRKAIIPVEGP